MSQNHGRAPIQPHLLHLTPQQSSALITAGHLVPIQEPTKSACTCATCAARPGKNWTKGSAVIPETEQIGSKREFVDRFYMKHGPCCAGCDWWHFHNALVGECHRTAPVSGIERVSMLGITGSSLPPGSGHILTRRDHHCGEFADTFDWSTLPLHYLRRIKFHDRAPALKD